MRRSLSILLVLLAFVVPGCGEGSGKSTGAGTVESSGIVIPSQLVGLTVKVEDVSGQTKEIKQSYVDSLGMFSMREDELLRATLQVSRLSRIARPQSAGFRRSIVSYLGGSTPIELRVGGTTVYSTSGNKQNIFIWFRERGMFILSVHQDFAFPRTLLRKVVGLEVR